MRLRKLIAVTTAAALSVLVSAGPASASTRDLDRIAGDDRYATAAEISAATFGPGVPVAYIASGTEFADALAGAAAAGSQSVPVLLTSADRVRSATIRELQRLQPQRIVVLGGESAVSPAVETALNTYTTGSVTRLSGDNRYATAAAISASAFPNGADTVYLAAGENYPDALAGAAAAGAQDAPVLLVRSEDVPGAVSDELVRLAPRQVVVLGGEQAVSGGVVDEVRASTGASVSRLDGANRYATATAVARTTGSTAADTVYLASGEQFPDALAGASVAAAQGSPILLVKPTSLPTVAREVLDEQEPNKVVVLGGTGAVSNAVADQAAGVVTEVQTDTSFSAERDRLTAKLNDYRKQNGVASLPRHPRLDELAQQQAQWMAENKQLQHTQDLKAKLGSDWIAGSEIIVRHTWPASMTTEDILTYMHGWWRGSPVHNTNMLRAAWNDRYTVTHVGTGYYVNQDGQPYGVHIFGSPR